MDIQALFNLNPKVKVRTRFAPSPTGFLHVGGAYICMNGFMIVSTLLFLHFVSDADKAFGRSIRLGFFVFFVISNLYYLLLPIIMKNLDRVLLLVHVLRNRPVLEVA